MEKICLISDYTPLNEPNYLEIIQDEQGDFHMRFVRLNENERNLRVALDGTRYSYKVRKALSELMKAIKEDNVEIEL